MHQVVAYKRLKTMENYKQPPMKFGHGCFKEVVVFNCKGRYTLGDKLQQHVAATHCSEKSLRVYWKICVKISVPATEVCCSNMLQKIKSDRICATCRGDKILLKRQRVSPNFSSRHEVICCCDVSPQHVAATSCRTCTHRVICRHNLSPSVYQP